MKRKDLKVTRGKERYAWSTGEIVDALQGAGVLTDAALGIARTLESQLLTRAEPKISIEELVERLEKLIAERVNPQIAGRFAKQTPPFVPLKVRAGDTVEKLSVRKLARSLESIGLKFKAANGIARQVEQTLRTQGRETVPSVVVSHLVAMALEASYGGETRARFEATLGRPAEIDIIEPDGSAMPFSRGVVSRSMMAVGLGPEMSYRLATAIESRLWNRPEQRVPRSEIRAIVTEKLRDEAGEQFARRYDLLHSFKDSSRPTIVLVGGAPGVGKSTIAAELAYRLGIGRLVSTDSIREALRSLISKELSPVLHASTFNAWKAELLPAEGAGMTPATGQVIRGFMSQVRMLGPAINGIINRTFDEASSIVLEGVHLVPSATMSTENHDFGDAQVISLLLVVRNEDSHRDHFAVRERQTSSKRMQKYYAEHFKEVRILQDYLIEQAELDGVPVIDATDADDAVEAALHHVLSSLFASRLNTLERPGSGQSG